MGYVKFTETVGDISKTYEFGSYEDFKDWVNGLKMEEYISDQEGVKLDKSWFVNLGSQPCSVDPEGFVEVVFRNGQHDTAQTMTHRWVQTGSDWDILQYRVL